MIRIDQILELIHLKMAEWHPFLISFAIITVYLFIRIRKFAAAYCTVYVVLVEIFRSVIASGLNSLMPDKNMSRRVLYSAI